LSFSLPTFDFPPTPVPTQCSSPLWSCIDFPLWSGSFPFPPPNLFKEHHSSASSSRPDPPITRITRPREAHPAVFLFFGAGLWRSLLDFFFIFPFFRLLEGDFTLCAQLSILVAILFFFSSFLERRPPSWHFSLFLPPLPSFVSGTARFI